MGLEQSDVYIVLRDRQRWRPGLTKEELAKEISEVIDRSVPEIAGAISQPIQMRTNELVAGVRSDVAILIYGADLETLRSSATGSRPPSAACPVPRTCGSSRSPACATSGSSPIATSSRATASRSRTSTR